jgi:hypothetical protein
MANLIIEAIGYYFEGGGYCGYTFNVIAAAEIDI